MSHCWRFQRFRGLRNASSPYQSLGGRQEVGIVLHFFSLFLPGIFLLLTGGAASLPAVERGAPFFQQGLLHPSFCSKTVFIWKAFLALNSSGGAEPTNRRSHQPATSPLAANLNTGDLISIRYRWASGATCLGLRSDSVNVRPVSMWAILLAFHNYPFYVVPLRVKVQWKLSVFHVSGNLIEAVCLKKEKPPC